MNNITPEAQEVKALDGSPETGSPAPEASAPESDEFPGYRALMVGEIIQKGDRCRDLSSDENDPRLLPGDSIFIGSEMYAGDVGGYFRPLPESAKRSGEAVAEPAPINLVASALNGMALGDHMVSKYFPKSPAPSSTEARK